MSQSWGKKKKKSRKPEGNGKRGAQKKKWVTSWWGSAAFRDPKKFGKGAGTGGGENSHIIQENV